MRLFGQFQTVSRRHRRGEFGVLKVCIGNVIYEGTLIEPYIEVPRSSDMWALGRIPRDTWLQWDADTLEGMPRNMVVLKGEQPSLDKIAEEVHYGGEGFSVMDTFNPDPSAILHVEYHDTDAIPDGFLKPSRGGEKDVDKGC